MDFTKAFTTNLQKEVEGVWVVLDPITGAAIKVARMFNTRYKQRVRQLNQQYAASLQIRGELPAETQEDILKIAVAESVLLDWKNFTENGQPLPPYTAEEGKKRLEWRDFRNIVVDAASQIQHFQDEQEQALTKN